MVAGEGMPVAVGIGVNVADSVVAIETDVTGGASGFNIPDER